MSDDLPPIPDFPEWLPLEGEGTVFPPHAVTGLVDVTTEPLDFTPVPRLRNRRGGWTAETQALFIGALEQCGCVSQAAQAVGMNARGAYRLLGAAGADGFAAAWDQAIARGIDRLRADAFERAFSGAWVPVYRKGRLVRVEHRRLDRLAVALLSGRDGSVSDNRERAASRRRYRLFLAEKQREKAAEQADLAAKQAAYVADWTKCSPVSAVYPRRASGGSEQVPLKAAKNARKRVTIAALSARPSNKKAGSNALPASCSSPVDGRSGRSWPRLESRRRRPRTARAVAAAAEQDLLRLADIGAAVAMNADEIGAVVDPAFIIFRNPLR